tara:strand:+ start:491 stop:667 length:177 start_codon:yes stop_codon:yes gene_type:complete
MLPPNKVNTKFHIYIKQPKVPKLKEVSSNKNNKSTSSKLPSNVGVIFKSKEEVTEDID